MKTSGVPRNAYTHTPEQHTNSILGSLQLLFWLFFRPSALRNHLERIGFALNSNSSLIDLLKQGLALWRWLFIQGYLFLPIVTDLLLGLVLWKLGKPGAPSSASDHAGFLYNLAREMEKSAKKQGVTLPSLAREVLKSDPFTSFYE